MESSGSCVSTTFRCIVERDKLCEYNNHPLSYFKLSLVFVNEIFHREVLGEGFS